MIGYLRNLYWRWRTRYYTWHATQTDDAMLLLFNRIPKRGWVVDALPVGGGDYYRHAWWADGTCDVFNSGLPDVAYVFINGARVKHE